MLMLFMMLQPLQLQCRSSCSSSSSFLPSAAAVPIVAVVEQHMGRWGCMEVGLGKGERHRLAGRNLAWNRMNP